MLQKIFILIAFFSVNSLYANIIVPKNETRKYKSIVLENGIQVILISDKEAQKAAAAIDVGVGSFDNPPEIDGLAHFLEHLLFLGNEKYPNTNEFSNFLSKRGGYNNAYTSSQNTNYHFQVSPQYLEEALDRLAEFFISPSFNEKYVQEEIQAVHSEYQKNLVSEPRRGFAVIKELSDPKHPFSRFHTGNLQTLSKVKNIRDEVILFYQKYYNPESMKVAVLGRESLKKLEELVRDKFEKIKTKEFSTPLQRYEEKVFLEKSNPAFVQIQSLKNIINLNFLFEVNSSRTEYEMKTSYYLSNLIGNEEKGSILSYLKEKNWATALSSGISLQQTKTDFFGINIELTPEGEKNIREIINVVFDYLSLIKKEGIEKWRFLEMKEIAQIRFDNMDTIPALSLVRFLSSQAHYYPEEDIIYAGSKFTSFSKEKIEEFLKQLVFKNLKIIYTSPRTLPLAKIEKWYNTAYKVEEISTSDLDYWTKSSLESLSLPLQNPYLSDKEPQILPVKNEGVIQKLPFKNINAYYSQNSSFKVPKTRVYIDILNPLAYESPKNASLARIYTQLLNYKLQEDFYAAYLLGYNFELVNNTKGLQLVLNGYSDKIEFFTLELLRAIFAAKFTRQQFLLAQQEVLQDWENLELSAAYRLANYNYQQLTKKPFWYYKDYLQILYNGLSFKDFTKFQEKIFQSVSLEIFIYGNINEENANILVEKTSAFFPEKIAKKRNQEKIIQLDVGEDYYFQERAMDINSAIVLSYQAKKSLQNEVKMDLLQNIISPEYYDFMRTNEQLGYLVWSYYTGSYQSNSFSFVVQSSVANPTELQDKTIEFLENFLFKLEKISSREFKNIKTGLQRTYQQKPENFLATSNEYYQNIIHNDFQLKKKKQLIKELRGMSQKQLIAFYQELFLAKKETKVLAIHILGKDLDKQTEILKAKEITNKKRI